MSLGAVIFLILLGLILIWLELLVIPGTTIAGIGGIILVGTGVYLAFDIHGQTAGLWSLGGSLILLIFSIIFFLKSNTWKKLSLKESVNSKVEYHKEGNIKPGDTGRTVTRLGPSGKIRINDEEIEAESLSGLIDPEEEVEVKQVTSNKIYVKLKK